MANTNAFKIKNGLDLGAYNKEISDTAVDVFVYDTSKDSDGGAWRKRTQATSWYNEALNTATRGSRREFPAVAVIVAESTQVTIYDGDDPDLPMWMVFNQAVANPAYEQFWRGTRPATSVFSLNGMLVFSVTASSVSGVQVSNFASDELQRYSDNSIYSVIYSLPVSGRNSTSNPVKSVLPFIVNDSANDVAMTVLPNAPLDAATGLPVPTIAVATDGGVSVIKDDGTVVDITWSGGGSYHDIAFSDTNKIIVGVDFSVAAGGRYVKVYEIPNADLAEGSYASQGSAIANYTTSSVIQLNANPTDDTYYHPSQYIGTKDTLHTILEAGYQYTWAGLSSVHGYENQNTAMLSQITSTYNTGHMVGNIKLATLSDTDDTDVTGSELVTNGTFDSDLSGWTTTGWSYSSGAAQCDGVTTAPALSQNIAIVAGKTYVIEVTVSNYSSGACYVVLGGVQPANNNLTSNGAKVFTVTATNTSGLFFTTPSGTYSASIDNVSVRLAEEDRSVNGNGLQVFGSIAKNPVATGADLVGYSGFSATAVGNYVQQPYNAALQFGTNSFCIMGWVKSGSTGSSNHSILRRKGTTSGAGQFRLRSKEGKASFWISDDYGVSIDEALGTTDIDNDAWNFLVAVKNSTTNVQIYVNGVLEHTDPITAATGSLDDSTAVVTLGVNPISYDEPWEGSLALFRISATPPSPEQIAKIYEDEKVLFQENAQATLYGSSDAATALAYDDGTELLHVGTSAGRSVFQGLRRVDNTTTAVSAAISASNNLVGEQ